MKTDARVLIAPLVAILILVLTVRQTSEALKSSGAWKRPTIQTVRPDDPYARLDYLLGQPQAELDRTGLRDPFSYHQAPVATRPQPRPTEPRPQPAPPPQPRPELTSLTWAGDQDPRATVRYNGRDYSIGINSLFAEFRVTSITRSQVVLDRNGERIVLTLRSKGE